MTNYTVGRRRTFPQKYPTSLDEIMCFHLDFENE